MQNLQNNNRSSRGKESKCLELLLLLSTWFVRYRIFGVKSGKLYFPDLFVSNLSAKNLIPCHFHASLNRCNGKLEFSNRKVIDKPFLGLRQIFFRVVPNKFQIFVANKKKFVANFFQVCGKNIENIWHKYDFFCT